MAILRLLSWTLDCIECGVEFWTSPFGGVAIAALILDWMLVAGHYY